MRNIVIHQDRISPLPPDAIRLHGLVGKRLNLSRLNRLRNQEEDHLLFAFQEKIPVGMHHPDRPRQEIYGDWQGEYIGTWLDAAVLSSWNAGDEILACKVESMVTEWLSTQQDDGYLGTFEEQDRWKSWDVWVQAHDLIGLMSYYHYTREKEMLDAAVRVADRVLADFGPGKNYLYPTGPHGGMASSSFLEPLIWLYVETGKIEYLTWAKWLVDEDWEQPDGPKIISSLNAGKGVAGTANAKGIEMLICFAGLVELFKVTGEDRYLDAVLIAWEDIVQHHLYISGSASTGEYFTADFALRNDGIYMLGETCVSMGWQYLNLKLGRLLGDSKFFNMAEQVLYNHLLAAQSPDGRGWAYYVGLRDSKRYRWHIDPECCPTRGVRALAQMPIHALGVTAKGLALNFYDQAEGEVELRTGNKVRVEIKGQYPYDGDVQISLRLQKEAEFQIQLRLPGWCSDWVLEVNGQEHKTGPKKNGYIVIKNKWSLEVEISLKMDMPVRVVADALGNNGRVAIVRGPLVFAADTAFLPAGMLLEDVLLLLDRDDITRSANAVRLKEGSVHIQVPTAILEPNLKNRWGREPERYFYFSDKVSVRRGPEISLVPFFDAGNLNDPDNYKAGYWTRHEKVGKITFQVWLPYRLQ